MLGKVAGHAYVTDKHFTRTGARARTPTGHSMNPNYRNLALWAIIAVLLIALFTILYIWLGRVKLEGDR